MRRLVVLSAVFGLAEIVAVLAPLPRWLPLVLLALWTPVIVAVIALRFRHKPS